MMTGGLADSVRKSAGTLRRFLAEDRVVSSLVSLIG